MTTEGMVVVAVDGATVALVGGTVVAVAPGGAVRVVGYWSCSSVPPGCVAATVPATIPPANATAPKLSSTSWTPTPGNQFRVACLLARNITAA